MATSRGFEEFARRWSAVITPAIEAEVGRLVRKGALVADQVAVLATPVDKGRARANWVASIARAREDVPNDVTEANPIDAGSAAQLSLSQANAEVGQYKAGAGGIFLSNNVEYIGPLDQGRSRQAPRGMTAAAAAAAIATLRKDGIRFPK